MINKDVEISILLALILCVDEQVNVLNDVHKYNVKQKFKKLKKITSLYEKEVTKSMELTNEYGIEEVKESIMNSLSEAKEKAYKQ